MASPRLSWMYRDNHVADRARISYLEHELAEARDALAAAEAAAVGRVVEVPVERPPRTNPMLAVVMLAMIVMQALGVWLMHDPPPPESATAHVLDWLKD